MDLTFFLHANVWPCKHHEMHTSSERKWEGWLKAIVNDKILNCNNIIELKY